MYGRFLLGTRLTLEGSGHWRLRKYPGFRPLVRAALETGCRYNELTRLEVHDLNPGTGTIAIRKSKSGKPRHVILTPEGAKRRRRRRWRPIPVSQRGYRDQSQRNPAFCLGSVASIELAEQVSRRLHQATALALAATPRTGPKHTPAKFSDPFSTTCISLLP
jgi:integrase